MSRPRTVLCVDDSEEMRDSLQLVLEDDGYQVVAVGSCAEANAAARRGFDVALVDLQLPDGDGVTLVGELRALQPENPVIILTGHATYESAVGAVRSGAWAFVKKPVSANDLSINVANAMRQVDLVEERRDLVQQARLNEKLAAIGTLTADLSHELKNPLNAATLQLTVLGRRILRLPAESQSELREPLVLVQEEFARMNHTLQEFLDFVRPRELHKQAVDLAASVRQVAELLAGDAGHAGIRLEHREPDTLTIGADGNRLNQAIVKLVQNALRVTPEGGTVRLELVDHGTTVVLAVEDNGPGVPEHLAKHVYGPFVTSDESGPRLGLAAVHGVVDQHGGTISVERASAGGTRMVVRLPVA